LIFESKIEKFYDYIVLITTDWTLRLNRTILAKKITEKDFVNRDSSQINDESKKKKADFIFTNDGSISELNQKAILLINLLKPTLE
jgi:dephospho-CoA kinase